MKKAHQIMLLILASWLSLTLFVDILAVPTIFRQMSNRWEAGNVGMIIFSSFNTIEVVLSVLIFILGLFCLKSFKWKKTFIAGWILLLAFSFSYKFYFTPQIIKLSLQMREIGEEGPGHQTIFEQHTFYHELYKKLDTAKMALLLILILGGLRKNKREEYL